MKLKKLLKSCPVYMEVFIHGTPYPAEGCLVVDAIAKYPYLDAKVKKIASMSYVDESSNGIYDSIITNYLDIDITRSV